MSQEMKPNWKLTRVEPENEDVTSVFIEPPEGDSCPMRDRRPGQFASIRVKTDDGWSEPHPFTISCDPEDEQVRFTIKSAGRFTSSIRGLSPGTEIMCQGPYGLFCKDIEQRENIVMIAGGVGITPFLSVLRFFRKHRAGNRVLLFWCNKTMADAFARAELEEMTTVLDLRVVHVISREEPPEAREVGVMYEKGHFSREALARHMDQGQLDAASFYLCGPPAMQETVLGELTTCGVDADRVQREAFGK